MGDYIIHRSNEENELYHHGVKGMKWGVRKSEYKSMTRQQRKEQRKKYYDTPEGKIKKATTIGTVLGGPIGGIIAGSVAAKKMNDIPKGQVKKGKDACKKHADTKIETDEQKIIRLKEEGKIGENAHHIFDQNGNLMMVYWDD